VGVGSIKTTIGEVFLFVDPNRVGMGVAANPIAPFFLAYPWKIEFVRFQGLAEMGERKGKGGRRSQQRHRLTNGQSFCYGHPSRPHGLPNGLPEQLDVAEVTSPLISFLKG